MSRVEHIGNATLYLGDCREIEWRGLDIVTDPPYGIGYEVNERYRTAELQRGLRGTRGMAKQEARGAIVGDNEPFDPTPWLRARAAFFGAQHFSSRLPQGRWLVWDKRDGSVSDDHSDCDLIWMTGDSREAMRIHGQKWRGVVRAGEENCSNSPKLHPNQKPVALIARIFDMLGVTGPVGDPYMGSASIGVVALRRGQPFVGCEIELEYFDAACRRIEHAQRQSDLFIADSNLR